LNKLPGDPYDAMAMIRKGQVLSIGGRDIKARARFIDTLFEVTGLKSKPIPSSNQLLAKARNAATVPAGLA
jgi:hypothetical protein